MTSGVRQQLRSSRAGGNLQTLRMGDSQLQNHPSHASDLRPTEDMNAAPSQASATWGWRRRAAAHTGPCGASLWQRVHRSVFEPHCLQPAWKNHQLELKPLPQRRPQHVGETVGRRPTCAARVAPRSFCVSVCWAVRRSSTLARCLPTNVMFGLLPFAPRCSPARPGRGSQRQRKTPGHA